MPDGHAGEPLRFGSLGLVVVSSAWKMQTAPPTEAAATATAIAAETAAAAAAAAAAGHHCPGGHGQGRCSPQDPCTFRDTNLQRRPLLQQQQIQHKKQQQQEEHGSNKIRRMSTWKDLAGAHLISQLRNIGSDPSATTCITRVFRSATVSMQALVVSMQPLVPPGVHRVLTS